MSFDLRLINGDLALSGGDLAKVIDLEKLAQDIVKIISTRIGANQPHKWYGSAVLDRVVASPLPKNLVKQEATNAIMFALSNLKSLQEQQGRIGQFLTPGEQIAVIRSVTLSFGPDPRQLNINIAVQTKTGKLVTENLQVLL